MDDHSLDELLFERVADAALTERVKELVLASYEGDTALASAVAGTHSPAGTDVERDSVATAPEMYLRRIRVAGFRGIGAEAVLELDPGPGLTVVTGRNGSGKSSFAEAAELVLTGENQRWSGKQHNTQLWRDGWRNLHTGAAVDIGVDLVITGDDRPTTVQMSWPDGRDLDSPEWTVQRHGSPRTTINSALWSRELELYRPFLSHDELGSVFEAKPSALHDHLHRLLGLGALDDALARLATTRLAREARGKELKATTTELVALLADVDDPRARRAEILLQQRSPDLAAVAGLASHNDDTTEIARLNALLAVALPTPLDVDAAAERVRVAIDRQAAVTTQAASAADTTSALLEQALGMHDEHGDRPCPVCGDGTLDAGWRARAQQEYRQARALADDVRTARAAVTAAVQSLRDLIVATPVGLRDQADDPAVDALTTVWDEWFGVRAATGAVAAASAMAVHTRLTSALADVRAMAEKAVARLDSRWQPAARRLVVWHTLAEEVAADKVLIAELKRAEAWLKAEAADLRDVRMAPIADQTAAVWAMMRQHSDVELGALKLASRGPRRHVALDVTIDDTATTAYSVMSQGELHTLGLSLFLPRATMAASPFRFIVIDDPVQAMDPGKVSGLAEVLADVARTRQVIVFSHDDRLADAVRRLPRPPTIREVQRRKNSAVRVVCSADPIARYLDDARALAHTREMPDELRRELVANCCRGAIEAAAQRRIRTTRLAKGTSHADVEADLSKAHTTHALVTLAVFDDPTKGGELLPRLNREGPWAATVLRQCKAGAHAGVTGDLTQFTRDAERLARWLAT